MIARPTPLIQAACISLLLALLAGTAVPQEPNAQRPGKNAGEPEQQEPGAVVAPPAAEDAAEVPQTEEPVSPAPAAETSAPVDTEKGPVEYTIKQGDTLWDIANAFLKDPFLWPFLWKANPSIANPDLIYAGNRLMVPSLAPIERALLPPAEAAPEEQIVEKEAPPAKAAPVPPSAAVPEEAAPPAEAGIIAPEERLQPVIDKYAYLNAGFVNDVENSGAIVGSAVEGKTMFGYDDLVYVRLGSKSSAVVGDRFLIYTPLHAVKHPRTRAPYGRLIRGLGILQVTAKDPSADVLTARITLSFDGITSGSLLTPYEEPSPAYQPSEPRAKDISGFILETPGDRTIYGQTDVVYLDKGLVDGVDPGDSFVVYAEPEKKGFPRKAVGEVQVFLVKERTSTAVVLKSSDALLKGQAVDFKR